MYLSIHYFIVDQCLVYRLDVWKSHKYSHNYWIRLSLIRIKSFIHTSSKCFNMTPRCKGRLEKEVKKLKPFSKCYQCNESHIEEIQNNDVEVYEVSILTEANKVNRLTETNKVNRLTETNKVNRLTETNKVNRLTEANKVNRLTETNKVNRLTEANKVSRLPEANKVNRLNKDSNINVQELDVIKNHKRAESVHVFKDTKAYDNKSIQFLKSDEKLTGSENKTHESLATFSLRDLFRFRQFKMKHHPFIYYNTVTHPASVRGLSWSVFANEIYRLSTFANYPQASPKSASLLSSHGFVYIGNGVNDRVMCFYCGKEKENWRPEDVIQDVHRLLSPDCPQVLREMSTIVQALQSTFEDTINSLQINSSHHSENTLQANSSLSTENTLQINSSHPTENTLQINSSHPTENTLQINSSHPTENTLQSNSSHPTENTLQINSSHSTENTLQINSSHPTENTLQINSSIPTENSNTDSAQPQEPISRSVQNLIDDSIHTIATTSETRDNIDSVLGDLIQRRPTHSDLGIITERPKRPAYAHKIKRLQTFASWPRYHHLTPDELVEAGFYSAGSGDCTRCFYCGGGLRNWDEEDDVWVEHARWFPRCYYLRQKIGQDFINIVQDLHTQLDQITIDHIKQRLDPQSNFLNMDKADGFLRRDPAVNSVVLLGFQVNDVIEIAKMIKQEGDFLSAKSLIDKLETEGKQKEESLIIPQSSENTQTDIDLMRTLQEENLQIREQIICKICLEKDVSVVFLPCGHLVSCVDCSCALVNCPVCRSLVMGIARAIIS